MEFVLEGLIVRIFFYVTTKPVLLSKTCSSLKTIGHPVYCVQGKGCPHTPHNPSTNTHTPWTVH